MFSPCFYRRKHVGAFKGPKKRFPKIISRCWSERTSAGLATSGEAARKKKKSLASNLVISKQALPAPGADGKAESGKNGLVYFQVLSWPPPSFTEVGAIPAAAGVCIALPRAQTQIPSDARSPWCPRATGCHPERPDAANDSRRPGAS